MVIMVWVEGKKKHLLFMDFQYPVHNRNLSSLNSEDHYLSYSNGIFNSIG